MDDSRLPASRYVLFWTIAVVGCATDLVTKRLVFDHPRLFHGSEWWLWPGHVGIQKSLNEGALFGMGQGWVWVFAGFSVAVAVAIPVWLFVFRAARHLGLTIALGGIMGGVVGNLYDRAGLHGLDWGMFKPELAGQPVYAVRDWILVQWNDHYVWPNFNIADSLLVVGAAALLFLSYWGTPSGALSKEAPSETGEDSAG